MTEERKWQKSSLDEIRKLPKEEFELYRVAVKIGERSRTITEMLEILGVASFKLENADWMTESSLKRWGAVYLRFKLHNRHPYGMIPTIAGSVIMLNRPDPTRHSFLYELFLDGYWYTTGDEESMTAEEMQSRADAYGWTAPVISEEVSE